MAKIKPRLKTSLWVSALIARVQASGSFAAVLHKGDSDSGAVLVSVRGGDGRYTLYQAAQDMEGARIWMQSTHYEERSASEAIAKKRSFDDDLWVVEIEDREARHFLTERVAPAPL